MLIAVSLLHLVLFWIVKLKQTNGGKIKIELHQLTEWQLLNFIFFLLFLLNISFQNFQNKKTHTITSKVANC